MAKILKKNLIRSPDVFYFKISAPALSEKARPGQFVIVRIHEKGERIPLSLADINPHEGTISLIVMAVGKTTSQMTMLNEGENILDLCGPLGQPTDIKKIGRVLLVGGGFGAAPLYPIARAFKGAGNTVATIIGAKSRRLLLYEKELRSVSDKLTVTTDDGSYGLKGMVTDALKGEIMNKSTGLVVAVGPALMMKAVSEITRPLGVKTIVSLNPIMIDGSGMCGGCRISVSGKMKFACTEGPEFDGHEVDWDVLINRQKIFMNEEKESFEEWKRRHAHLLMRE